MNLLREIAMSNQRYHVFKIELSNGDILKNIVKVEMSVSQAEQELLLEYPDCKILDMKTHEMKWETLQNVKRGVCQVRNKRTWEISQGQYERGWLYRGKNPVFYGYQISVSFDEHKIVGKSVGDSESFQPVLRNCNEQIEALGYELLVAGNSKHYSESAMSGGAGCGYLQVDIMTPFSDDD
jgi:hypothetical protein